MSIQLTLFCQATTAATRQAAFAADDPLDAAGLEAAQRAAGGIRRVDAAWSSPAQAARATALRLALFAEPALPEIDYGRWTGRAMDEVGQTDPAGVAAWLSDPFSAPHGGESIDRAVARAALWMGSLDDTAAERVIAVTHASIIRAAIVTALGAPLTAFWRIDVAPLCRACLQRRGRVWTLRWVGPV